MSQPDDLNPQEVPEDPSWRQQFPYHWDSDEMVTRREFVRFAVLTSGALFIGTIVLGILGRVTGRTSKKRMFVANTADLHPGEATYFHYPHSGDQAMLIQLKDGTYHAYSQKCTHLSCAVYYEPKKSTLYCPCHEGYYDPATGDPTAGPPQRPLPEISLDIVHGKVYATGESA